MNDDDNDSITSEIHYKPTDENTSNDEDDLDQEETQSKKRGNKHHIN